MWKINTVLWYSNSQIVFWYLITYKYVKFLKDDKNFTSYTCKNNDTVNYVDSDLVEATKLYIKEM